MLHVLVRLEVKDFAILAKFELQAAQIMASYGGQIVAAFETERNADNSGKEVHLLTFPDTAAFDAYRQDAALLALSSLRKQAIADTSVEVSISSKVYEQAR